MIQPDTVLQDRYRIERHLTTGGMGAVYVATDQRLGTTVAVKQMAVDFAAHPEARDQFEREARLLAKLRHPALVAVTDYFEEHDRQFLVMQFVPGADLGELLRESPHGFSVQKVLNWGHKLLEVLEFLHGQAPPIIHRDIKPRNIKLSERGEVVLLDFGLAKGLTDDSLAGCTLAYAPLEQIQQTGTGPRSDLYSLGATLYHLLTRRTPANALHRAKARTTSQPDPLFPPSRVNPRVSSQVEVFLGRAMAIEPQDRFASAAAMRSALRQLVSSHETIPVPRRVPAAEPKTVRVFLSTITPHQDDQARFIGSLVSRLERLGIEPVRCTPDIFDDKEPMTRAQELIETCRGAIVLGLERTHVYFLRDKEGAEDAAEEVHRKYTSSWLHLEAGIAHALGRDLFVLCQHDICSDGIFDRWWNTYPVTELSSLDADSPELATFLEHLRAWADAQRADAHA